MKHKTRAMRIQASRNDDWVYHHVVKEQPRYCSACGAELYKDYDFKKGEDVYICVNPNCKTVRTK